MKARLGADLREATIPVVGSHDPRDDFSHLEGAPLVELRARGLHRPILVAEAGNALFVGDPPAVQLEPDLIWAALA